MAATCYTKLNLCLLAIEQRKYEGGDIFINPKNKVINPNAIGKAFGPYSIINMKMLLVDVKVSLYVQFVKLTTQLQYLRDVRPMLKGLWKVDAIPPGIHSK